MSQVRKARGRLADEVRRLGANDSESAARSDLARVHPGLSTAGTDEYIERVLAKAPPLTPEQNSAIARLLGGERS